MRRRGPFWCHSLDALTHKDPNKFGYLKQRHDLYFVGELQDRRSTLGVPTAPVEPPAARTPTETPSALSSQVLVFDTPSLVGTSVEATVQEATPTLKTVTSTVTSQV